MPSKLRNLVNTQRPDIKIEFSSKKDTYTTLDRIEGVAIVTAPVDTDFDTIEVEFIGTSRTYVERLTTAAAASGRSEAFHQFLKLCQPGLEQHYPHCQVLKAGIPYKFPFVFAVPQQLLPRICQHAIRNDTVREYHYRLPPTFGDKDLAGRQKGLDDIAPDMASIRYGIFARVTELKPKGDTIWRSIVASKARRVRVIPAIEEEPPLDVHPEDGEYILRKEKVIKKGMLKSRLGTLIAESVQPRSLKLQSYCNPEGRSDSMATVMLRFDPLDDESPPPKLGNLSSKLKVVTYFGSTARQTFPTKAASILDISQGLHTEQLNLSSRCVTNVDWTKHDPSSPETIQRRQSQASASSFGAGVVPEPSEGYKGGMYYTARVVVPISLPAHKSFPPTFHSCLISRVYTLKLDLNVTTLSFGSSMELKLPVQVSTEELVGDELIRRGSVETINEVEIESADVSNFFTNFFEPRTIRMPSQQFVGRSRIGSAPVAPPSTEDLSPGYSPAATANARRLSHNRAMSVPVY